MIGTADLFKEKERKKKKINEIRIHGTCSTSSSTISSTTDVIVISKQHITQWLKGLNQI